MTNPQPPVKARALIDTGATHVVIDLAFLAGLALPHGAPISHSVVGGATTLCDTFECNVLLMGGRAADRLSDFTHTTENVRAIKERIIDADVILGWDVLRFYDVTFGRDGVFVLRAG